MKKNELWAYWQLPVILLLSISAVILFSKVQLLPAEPVSFSQLFSDPQESPTSDLSQLHMPVQAVVNNGYGRNYFFGTTESTSYLRFLPLLQEAFGSAVLQPSPSQEAFAQAMLSPGIFFDFGTDYPAELFYQLYLSEAGSFPGAVRHLILSTAEDGQRVFLYLSDEAGNLRCFSTAVSATSLLQALENTSHTSASFAMEYSDTLYPYTIYPDDLSIYPQFGVSNAIDDDLIQTLAQLLGMNSHSEPYVDSNGTQVLVEESSSLRVYGDGTISYQGLQPVSDLLSVSGGDNPSQLDALNSAWALAVQLTADYCSAEQQLYLQSCQPAEGGYLIYFGYMLNGIPVQLHQDTFALRIRTNGNCISAFTLYRRSYTPLDSRSLLMPVRQAIAAGSDSGELWIGYADTGRETIAAQWLGR